MDTYPSISCIDLSVYRSLSLCSLSRLSICICIYILCYIYIYIYIYRWRQGTVRAQLSTAPQRCCGRALPSLCRQRRRLLADIARSRCELLGKGWFGDDTVNYYWVKAGLATEAGRSESCGPWVVSHLCRLSAVFVRGPVSLTRVPLPLVGCGSSWASASACGRRVEGAWGVLLLCIHVVCVEVLEREYA